MRSRSAARTYEQEAGRRSHAADEQEVAQCPPRVCVERGGASVDGNLQ